jgi:hypothetical protein
MRRILGHGILLTVSCALAAQSPIVITSTVMPVKNDSVLYTDVSPNSIKDYLTTGENYTWDFTDVTETGEGMRKFESPSSTPYPFYFFGNSTFGERVSSSIGAGPLVVTDFYNFYSKQTVPVTAYAAEGVGMTFSSIPLPAYYSDRDELYVYPLEYGDRDSTTLRFATLTSTMLPLSYSRTGHRITEVDGWGTVKTPFGTEECLRLVTTQYALDTMKISLLPFPLAFPTVVRSYQWLTLKSKIPYFEVSGTLMMDSFTPTTSRYRGTVKERETALPESTLQGVKFFPNPANDNLMFTGISVGSHYQISSLSGATLLSGKTEGQSIDISQLCPGIYFLQVESNSIRLNYRFICD